MTQRILIAYATKYGATAGIARKIGDVLQAAGLIVDVQPAEAVRDVTPYDAVILGSAVYAGQWRKEAVSLLEKHEQALAERPVWLFSSGPTGEGNPVEQMKGWTFPEAQRPIADRIQPREIAFFHGDIDMDKLNFGEKLLVKGIRAPTGDFRDWEMITAWAQGVAEALKQKA